MLGRSVNLLVFATAVVAQHGTSTPANSASASTTASISSTLVPTAGVVPLFKYEEDQLTTAKLQNLSKTDAALFSFDSLDVTSRNSSYSENHTLAGSGGECKVFPGDVTWPAPSTWDLLRSLTGGALVHGVPAASVCYFNGTSIHNDTACALLASNWTNSYTQ